MMIGLTTGHTLVVRHDKDGTNVPVQFRKEAIAKGCVPVGVGAEDVPDPQAEETRQGRIAATIEQMLDGGNEEDFTADGKPDLRALSRMAGFSISREERDAAWDGISKSPSNGE